MWRRAALRCGIAVPAIYLLTIVTCVGLNPGFDAFRREPSELGRPDANYPVLYDIGLITTAFAGLLASIALLAGRKTARGSIWRACAGITILLSSSGLAMAGLFPLPSSLHRGFGLTMAAFLTPSFGAAFL